MNALDPQAQALLALLVSRLGEVIPGQPETYIGYKEAHYALNLKYLGPTYGESLKKQGLLALANWVLAENKPAITGIIVDTTSYVPAQGYFGPYGKTEDDFDWWTEQVRLSKDFDWAPHLPNIAALPPVIRSNQPKPIYWWDQLVQENALGYNRQFLRVLRQLRDLRRYAPVVIQNAQQVNVGNQQVNVS